MFLSQLLSPNDFYILKQLASKLHLPSLGQLLDTGTGLGARKSEENNKVSLPFRSLSCNPGRVIRVPVVEICSEGPRKGVMPSVGQAGLLGTGQWQGLTPELRDHSGES